MIELRGVTKEYGTGDALFLALDNVSLKIESGEFVSILGPSGSGKSTLMHLIGGLDRPSEGHVIVDGRDLGRMNDRRLSIFRRNKIGFVFQQFNLLPNLTALRNVMLPLMYMKVDGDPKEYATRTLEIVKLGGKLDNRPSQLSGGEQQRVAIARALIGQPDIILADEPTGNLDSVTGTLIFSMFEELNRGGKTVVIVTHDEKRASKTNRIIRIADGELT